MEITKAQARAAVDAVTTVAEAIRSLEEVPSGELYAVVMSAGVSHDVYEKILGILTRAGLVERTPAHLLRWIGPKI